MIHNAGVGYREPRRIQTEDGLAHVFAINVLAPYLLTGLINRPDRLIYLSSGMHHDGNPDLTDPQWTHRQWNGSQAYSDSKQLAGYCADLTGVTLVNDLQTIGATVVRLPGCCAGIGYAHGGAGSAAAWA